MVACSMGVSLVVASCPVSAAPDEASAGLTVRSVAGASAQADSRVLRIAPDGMIHPFAGTGSATGPDGDGGPALSAVVGAIDVVVGLDGTAYLYETESVRTVDPNGIITTLIGKGTQYPGELGPAAAVRYTCCG